MRRRAATHGGTLHLHTPPGGGTQLTWTANIVTESEHPRV